MFKKMNLIALIAIFSLGLSVLPFYPVVSADDNEIKILERKISELEERIQCLETLLNEYQLEDRAQMSKVFEWENKKNWRKLELGMSESQVEDILGEPVKMIKGVRTLWYYPDKYCGYVSFDKDGRLSGWNEP
ncbi:MAG: outer membrane protein assembly factor BamE [Deltaproteobacteria bacterium]|nr:outer membrane protein assembly factor BamE [Deltaproteobacteria bacterium]